MDKADIDDFDEEYQDTDMSNIEGFKKRKDFDRFVAMDLDFVRYVSVDEQVDLDGLWPLLPFEMYT